MFKPKYASVEAISAKIVNIGGLSSDVDSRGPLVSSLNHVTLWSTMGNKLRKFKDSIMNLPSHQETSPTLTDSPKEDIQNAPGNSPSQDTPLTNTTAHTNARADGGGETLSDQPSDYRTSATPPESGQPSSKPSPVSDGTSLLTSSSRPDCPDTVEVPCVSGDFPDHVESTSGASVGQIKGDISEVVVNGEEEDTVPTGSQPHDRTKPANRSVSFSCLQRGFFLFTDRVFLVYREGTQKQLICYSSHNLDIKYFLKVNQVSRNRRNLDFLVS